MRIRKIHIIIYLLSLLCPCFAFAFTQNQFKALIINNIELRRTGDEVTVGFTCYAGDKATKNGYSLIVQPVLQNEKHILNLPDITVQGRTARIAERRHLLATGQRERKDRYSIENGEFVSYTASVPYQEWMSGAELVLNGVSVGCCSATETVIGVIAENLFPDQVTEEIIIEETVVPVEQALSTGDKLAAMFPFLTSLDSPEGDMTGSLTIYFPQGNRVIDRGYKDNNKSLIELISAVRAITSSTDSKVKQVVIAGFASPEGYVRYNEQLAWDRGIALRNFLTENTRLTTDLIRVYNGSVDWEGLRKLVADSDMYEKSQILNIIDSPLIESASGKDERLNRLKSLNGGVSYRYMLNNFFPLLRNAAYIKVYYENL